MEAHNTPAQSSPLPSEGELLSSVGENLTMNMLNCPDVLSVMEAAKVLRVGRTTMYKLMQSGKIRHFNIGKKILIPRKYLQLFIEKESNECYNESTDGRNLPCCGKE